MSILGRFISSGPGFARGSAMAMRMKFEGGSALESALGQLEKAATRKASAWRALKKAAEPIFSKYQAGTTVKTGHLVESEILGTKLTTRQTRLNRKLGKAEVEVHVGTADPAGIQQEFGNVNHSANPALRPAWDAEGGQKALGRIGEEMWIDIGKTAARAAKRKG